MTSYERASLIIAALRRRLDADGSASLERNLRENLAANLEHGMSLADAVELGLNIVQDDIGDDGIPWPAWPPGQSKGDPLPPPQAVLRGASIYAWFGDEAEPALRLEPIPLDELAS